MGMYAYKHTDTNICKLIGAFISSLSINNNNNNINLLNNLLLSYRTIAGTYWDSVLEIKDFMSSNER